MTIDISVLRAMAAAGASVEVILLAIEEDQKRDDERRAKGRDRTQKWRAKRITENEASRDVTKHHVMSHDSAYIEDSSSTSPKSHKKKEKEASISRNRKTTLPDGYQADLQTRLHASALGITDSAFAQQETHFMDSARAHGRTYSDWQAAERGWMTNFATGRFGGNGNGRHVEKTNGSGTGREHSALNVLDDLFGPRSAETGDTTSRQTGNGTTLFSVPKG